MTLRVPVNQRWAIALWELLAGVVRHSDLDVYAAIERWQIDDEEQNSAKWFNNRPSLFLRSTLADLLKPNDELLRSDDLALRMSFYRRFRPWEYKDWPKFLDRDGGAFFESVLENMNIWRDGEERHRLAQVAWEVPDPRAMMDAPNNFRSREDIVSKKHPEWFDEEAIS